MGAWMILTLLTLWPKFMFPYLNYTLAIGFFGFAIFLIIVERKYPICPAGINLFAVVLQSPHFKFRDLQSTWAVLDLCAVSLKHSFVSIFFAFSTSKIDISIKNKKIFWGSIFLWFRKLFSIIRIKFWISAIILVLGFIVQLCVLAVHWHSSYPTTSIRRNIHLLTSKDCIGIKSLLEHSLSLAPQLLWDIQDTTLNDKSDWRLFINESWK